MPIRTRSFLGPLVNAVSACIVALFAVSYLTCLNVTWDPAYYGDFSGIDITDGRVLSVLPHSPAARAGFKTGDQLAAVQPFASRVLLINLRYPRAGERFTVVVERAGRPVTLVAVAPPMTSLPVGPLIIKSLLLAALAIFIATSLTLVILRPGRMTWGFLLFSFVVVFESVWRDPTWLPTQWLLPYLAVSDVLWAAGVVGFVLFCLNFPTDAPQRWARAIEAWAPFVVVVLAGLYTYQDIEYTVGGSKQAILHAIYLTCITIEQAVLLLGSVILLVRCFKARGLERVKLKWIVPGVVLTTIGFLISGADSFNLLPPNPALGDLLNLPYVGAPLAVAYTVFHHRVIDIRFVLSRAIVLGILAGTASIVIAAADWLTSMQLPNSHLEMAIYVGLALLAGTSLNAGWKYLRKMIDAISFKHLQRVQELAAIVARTGHGSGSTAELFDPLTRGAAEALSLASVALFERVEDGGYVRVASFGWPRGTLWHILPDHPLNNDMVSVRRPKPIDAARCGDERLPSGLACPTMQVPILVGRTIVAVLLFGAHENGAALDPDELRFICIMAADSAPLYAAATKPVGTLRAAYA